MNERPIKIAIGSDHAGYDLKRFLIEKLKSEWNYSVEDCGCFSAEMTDYHVYTLKVAHRIINGTSERGILICGNGFAMSMLANRVPGICAAVCHDVFSARTSRESGDANIIALGARILGMELAWDLLKIWLDTDFVGKTIPRYAERIKNSDEITQIFCHPEWKRRFDEFMQKIENSRNIGVNPLSEQSNPSRIIIFDLDNTLVNFRRYHRQSLQMMLQEVFGIDATISFHRHSGRPMPVIVRMICEEHGIPAEKISTQLPLAMHRLSDIAVSLMGDDIREVVLPGVYDLLEYLKKKDTFMVMATGSYSRTASVLVEKTGIKPYFKTFVYGDEAENRNDLLRLAEKRIQHLLPGVPLEGKLVVVGDTPHDIESGRVINARVVSVATGVFSMQDLEGFHPDVLLENFADVKATANSLLM